MILSAPVKALKEILETCLRPLRYIIFPAASTIDSCPESTLCSLFNTAIPRHMGIAALLPIIIQSLLTVASSLNSERYLPNRKNPSLSLARVHFRSGASWLSSDFSSPSKSASSKKHLFCLDIIAALPRLFR